MFLNKDTALRSLKMHQFIKSIHALRTEMFAKKLFKCVKKNIYLSVASLSLHFDTSAINMHLSVNNYLSNLIVNILKLINTNVESEVLFSYSKMSFLHVFALNFIFNEKMNNCKLFGFTF